MIEISARQNGNVGADSSPGNCACRCAEGNYLVANWGAYYQGNTCGCECGTWGDQYTLNFAYNLLL